MVVKKYRLVESCYSSVLSNMLTQGIFFPFLLFIRIAFNSIGCSGFFIQQIITFRASCIAKGEVNGVP